MDSEADNRALVRELADAYNERDRERFDACYGEELVVHGTEQDRVIDHEAHWEEVLGSFEVFADHAATIESLLAEGDRVFVRSRCVGTPRVALADVEPTETEVTWERWSEYRIEDGRIIEAWQLADQFGLWTDLGLIDPPDL